MVSTPFIKSVTPDTKENSNGYNDWGIRSYINDLNQGRVIKLCWKKNSIQRKIFNTVSDPGLRLSGMENRGPITRKTKNKINEKIPMAIDPHFNTG